MKQNCDSETSLDESRLVRLSRAMDWFAPAVALTLIVISGVFLLAAGAGAPRGDVEIKIGDTVYYAGVENGQLVLRDATGSVVSLPATAGIQIGLSPDGQGVDVAGGTGSATVRTRNTEVAVGPGQTARLIPTADRTGVQIQAVRGTLTCSGAVGHAAQALTFGAELEQGEAAVFRPTDAGNAMEITNVAGSATVFDGTGRKASLDGTDKISLRPGQEAGTMVLKVEQGSVDVTNTLDGTTATLESGQEQNMDTTAAGAEPTGPGKGAGKGEAKGEGKGKGGGSPGV